MEAKQQLHEKDTEEENLDDVLKALLWDKKLFSVLYPHQRKGILFLYNAYKNGKSGAEGSRNGVILADEMGLGKSIQVIVFLHFLIINTHKMKNALLVMPAGLLSDWKGKLENWTPDMNVFIYHNSEKELPKKLRQLQKKGGVLLVSYKMFIYHYKTLTTYKGMLFSWDCLIFDEAHKLKNLASKTHKIAASISAGFHILMTGTPIQNNLKEYWTLFSLISDTCLLGTYKTFKTNFENPITKGMEADSGPDERALGMKLQEELEKTTKPFLLRRRKDHIQDPSDQTPSEQGLCLPKKNEYVVWIKLNPEQEAAYCNIVDESYALTFQCIHYLIPVCTHPRLNSDIMGHEASEVHLAESGKLAFMLALLERLTANGNFVLVFSNYIKILNIIQKALRQTPWGRKAFLRIDGQNPNQRDEIIRRFQKKRSENILLLTTSVGAEGLTLTAADSVVFADLSWNQSLDAQAVGRAHRIGQTKEVATYRLVTCGTLEETMYRRQLFKGALTRQAMGDEQNPLRHFTQDELKTYLTLRQTQFSYTQQQLKKQGAKILNITEIFGEGINSLGAASVCGISDHGQLLSASQGEDLEVDMARMYITETAKMCKQEIEAESHLTRQITCEDLSVRKRIKKGKIKRKTEKVRTPGLPRKYKCFKTPFSGTRRKTLHITRPCVFESSDDDSSNLSADDDVSSSEESLPHISFSVKSEPTCSKSNSGINKSTNPKGTVEVSECISNDHVNTATDTSMPDISLVQPNETNEFTDIKEEPGILKTPVISEQNEMMCEKTALILNSDSYQDPPHISPCSPSASPCRNQKMILNHESSASSTMDEPSFSTSPEDGNIEKCRSSHLPEANTSENIATDTSMPDISLVQHNETDDITDLKEEAGANSPGGNFKDPKIEKTPVISEQNEMMCEKTTLNLNSDSYQDPPHISPFTPSASPCTTQKMILNHESSASSTIDKPSFSTSPEDGNIEKCGSSHLPETSTSENIATDTSMPDISLVQHNETDDITDLKEEAGANSPGGNFKDPKTEKTPVISEQNEMVCDKTALNLNSDFHQDLPHISPCTPSASPCTTQKMILNQEDQKLQEASKDLEVAMAELHIKGTTTRSHQEIEDESRFSRQTCVDVATRKPDRNAKLRRWSYETTTASQARKYKCYPSALSSTRRKTAHTLSDYSYSLSAHEEKISEKTMNIQNMSVTDLDMCASPATDFEEDVSSVAALANSSVYAEHISTPDNSEPVLGGMDNTTDSDISDSQSLKLSVSTNMDKPSFSTPPEDTNIDLSAHEERISEKTIQNMPVTDLDVYVSPASDFDEDLPAVAVTNLTSTNHEHIVHPSNGESVLDGMDKTVSANRNVSYVSDEDNYINKNDKDCLQEANNISVTSRSMTYTGLVQSSEADKLTDLEEEANSQTVADPSRQELKIQINDELTDEERVPFVPLNLNILFSEISLNSTTSEPSPELQRKEPQLSDSSWEDFKTDLKSNRVVSVLCDYSLTPSCISVCGTPSAGNERHYTDLRQLGECDEFSVLKEEETCQDFSTTCLDLSTHSSEYHQQLNLPQMQDSVIESIQSSSEREVNLKDHEVADISYKNSFKTGLKFSQTALKLCDYSLTPGCISLVDTPSVEKGKRAVSGNFQSTPLQSGQVVYQESLDHLKGRLAFYQGNSGTPVKPSAERKLDCESSQENDSDSNFSQVIKTTMERNEVQIINSEKQVELRKISINRTADKQAFNAMKYSHRIQFDESIFSPATPKWKYGKENHDRLNPTLCGYSLNSSTFSQSSAQAGKTTEIQPVKGEHLIREDTEDTDQLFPMNRAFYTNQAENHTSRAKTIVSEMFSSKKASFIKALGNLLFPKRQRRRTRRDSSCNSKRPHLSMTYRRNNKRLLKSMRNVHKEPVIVDRSDAHVSLIPNDYMHGLVAKKSAPVSPSGSCPELTKETSPTQKMQESIQYQCIKPLNEIPEDESVQCTKIVNVDVKSVHGLCTEGRHKTPVLKAIFSSNTPLNQVIPSSNSGNYPECSTGNTMKSASSKDHEDHDSQSASQDDIFLLSPISSVPDSVTSNGQSFTSGYTPMWDMSFSPEIQYTPRKEGHISKVINQANSNPHKTKIEQFRNNESSGHQLPYESYLDCCSTSENNDDPNDAVEQSTGPLATLITYNIQSPSEEIVTAETDERGGIRAFKDVSQFLNQTNRASEIREIQPQAEEMGGYAERSESHKAPLEEGHESMLKYMQNDAKSENASDISTSVDELFCLLHKLKRL